MSDDLKSCPFCGSDDLGSGGDDKVVGYWCNSCQAAGPNHYGRYEWNSRADRIEELQARVAELEAERKLDHENINLKADFIENTINQLAAAEARIEELQARVDELEKDLGCADAYQREWEQHCKTAEARVAELEDTLSLRTSLHGEATHLIKELEARADLPPTDAEVLEHPKVRALVDAAEEQLDYLEMCGEDDDLVRNLRAALAAIQEGRG